MTDATPQAATLPLHFQVLGAGQPLIILHGLFGSSANWKPVARRLSESYQVFLVDLRNHGRSPHSEVVNYPVMAADIRAFMAAHSIPSAHLLGHSMGGKTAMQFALTYPNQIDKLIVVDIAPKAYSPRHNAIFAALRGVDLSAVISRADLDARLAPHLPDAALRQFLMMNAASDAAGHWHWRMHLDALYRNYDALNQGLTVNSVFEKPTLFIQGGNSDYMQPEDSPVIKSHFPQAQLVTIPGASHWVQAAAPDEFARVVLEFLQGY